MATDKKRSASERLQINLEESILNRKYTPGERLPSERKIMASLKVGRGTVREAYRALQQKGLIKIRRGGGAYVEDVDSSLVGDTLSTLMRHRQISTPHLQEFREAIESRCAAYAAERATAEQIDELKNLVAQMESVLKSSESEIGKFYDLELTLHTKLAEITGNPMFEWFAVTIERNSETFNVDYLGRPEMPETAIEDWHNFIQAVEKREVTKAAMIMRTHVFRFGKLSDGLGRNNG